MGGYGEEGEVGGLPRESTPCRAIRGGWLIDAWSEPDHYAWMVGYLRTRGLATRVRLLIAGVTATYLLLPVSMLYTPAGPQGPWIRVAVLTAEGVVLLSATAAARRWPTSRQSLVGALIASIGTAVVCLSYSDVVVGLVGVMTFALVGGYIAFFHSLRLQVLNLGLGLLTANVLTTRALLGASDVIVIVNLYVVVSVVVVALPTTAHVLAHFLGGDLDTSDIDPLTGLLNRRSFYRATHRLLATTGGPAAGHLSVLMIDLDDFKNLNDTHGHRTGDTALVHIARLLTTHTPDRAVVARIGGEEFLVADLTADPTTATACATDLCTAIDAIDYDITASIGIATTTLPAPDRTDAHLLLEHLIDLADTAMFTAKYAGGNQHHTAP